MQLTLYDVCVYTCIYISLLYTCILSLYIMCVCVSIDPQVKVVGSPEGVSKAREMLSTTLDTKSNRVTLKVNVAYREHSHVIGREGANIKKGWAVIYCVRCYDSLTIVIEHYVHVVLCILCLHGISFQFNSVQLCYYDNNFACSLCIPHISLSPPFLSPPLPLVHSETQCHIHFPDSNRFNQGEKSDQVSITGSYPAIEIARKRVRVCIQCNS